MFDRENLVGFLLLGVCGVVAAVLLVSIYRGERIRLDISTELGWVLAIAFFGLIIVGFARNFSRGRGGGGHHWPDPQTGRKSWWDRLRGR